MAPSKTITIELMDLLNEINRNVHDVRERLARIEAQTHAADIEKIEKDLKEEREKRQQLEIEVSNIRTKLAPVFAGISIVVLTSIELLFLVFKP